MVNVVVENRFWTKVNVQDGCWLWTASRSSKGYGMFWFEGQTVSAHRFSYELYNGSIPEGMVVRHKCDNPPCVNPDHLELGTQAANERDKIVRGRYRNGNMQKRYCPQGHEYTAENTLIYSNSRWCRTCKRDRQREYRARKRV